MARGGIVLTVIILIMILVVVYLTFFYAPRCSNISCWEYKLQKCKSASYINNAGDVVWKYTIKGKNSDNCVVEVKVLQVIRGLMNAKVIEGKKMECELPLGILMAPEKDLNMCHGRLKEEVQTLIIENSHRYLFESIEEIGGEV